LAGGVVAGERGVAGRGARRAGGGGGGGAGGGRLLVLVLLVAVGALLVQQLGSQQVVVEVEVAQVALFVLQLLVLRVALSSRGNAARRNRRHLGVVKLLVVFALLAHLVQPAQVLLQAQQVVHLALVLQNMSCVAVTSNPKLRAPQ